MDVNYQEKVIFPGKWLIYKHIHFKIGDKDCLWEVVERPFQQGGVSVIPVLKQKGQPDKLILIANFRVPIRKYTLEFPAGLLDTDSVQENALRELQEETGYTASKIYEYKGNEQRVYYDPWKSTEKGYLTTVEVIQEQNQNPKQNLEEEENIKVHLINLDNKLLESLNEFIKQNNYEVEDQLWCFAQGYCLANIIK